MCIDPQKMVQKLDLLLAGVCCWNYVNNIELVLLVFAFIFVDLRVFFFEFLGCLK
jgi:hypothetical protein